VAATARPVAAPACRAPGPAGEHAARALVTAICGDIVRPSLAWLVTARYDTGLAPVMAAYHDPAGFAPLAELCDHAGGVPKTARSHALRRAAVVLAAKGGTLAGIEAVADGSDAAQVDNDLDPAADYGRVDRVVVGVDPHVVVPGQPRAPSPADGRRDWRQGNHRSLVGSDPLGRSAAQHPPDTAVHHG